MNIKFMIINANHVKISLKVEDIIPGFVLINAVRFLIITKIEKKVNLKTPKFHNLKINETT